MVRTVLAVLLLACSSVAARAADLAAAENVLGTLDYIAVDYAGAVANGQVINAKEYDEQIEFATRIVQQVAALAPSAEQAQLREEAATLLNAVRARLAPDAIAKMSNTLAANIVDEFQITVAPRRIPDIASASALYADNCAACHGATGHGDGERAANLSKAPANFHDVARQQQRSIYSLYGVISHGVDNTDMSAFTQLSDAQRWALAFYVGNFAATPEQLAIGERVWESGALNNAIVDVAGITASTAVAMHEEHGDDGVALLAYLRAYPEALAKNFSSGIDVSFAKLRESVTELRAGRNAPAYDAAVAAYLQGYELVEMQLRMVAPELSVQIEDKMAAYREYLGGDKPQADVAASRAGELEELLQQASTQLGTNTMTPLMGAFSAFILLLREGVEAILVLSAIVAFLIKTERRESLRYVHAGWTSALLLGVVTWVVAAHVFSVSGANREVTEGVTALLAAAILVYMGYWLHNNANIQRWKEFIHSRLRGKSLWTLVFVSFLAVYREVFETILFFETLWLQMPEQHNELMYGIAAAAASLTLIAYAMFRFSVRLPLRLFFNVNAVLLFTLAVIFTGKGIAALQEAGKLHIHPINFPRIDVLGIFPNIEVLGAQAALLVLAAAWLVSDRLKVSKLKTS